MVKLVAIITFLLNGAPVGQETLAFRQPFETVAACQEMLTSEANVAAIEKLQEQVDGFVAQQGDENFTATLENKCVAEERRS